MLRAVRKGDAKFHSSDKAIETKLNCHFDYIRDMNEREKACAEILHKREFLRKFPEINAEGRVASYDYLGIKRWYDENGVDEDGYYSDGESATEGEFNRDGWRYEKRPGIRTCLFRRKEDNEDESANEEKIREAMVLVQKLLETPGISLGQFAKKNGLTKEEVENAIKLAKKNAPNMESALREHMKETSRRSWAILCTNRDKLVEGKIDLREFWEKALGLRFSNFVYLVGPEQILDCILREMGGKFDPKNPESIHVLARATNSMYYGDLSKRIEELAKELGEVGRGRDFATIRRFVRGFSSGQIDLLLNESFSIDGGRTMVKITKDDIEQAKAKIKKEGGLICQRTVSQEIVNTYRANQK